MREPRRAADGNNHRRYAAVGALVAVVLLLATAVAVVPTLDEHSKDPAPRTPAAGTHDLDVAVGPPAAAAPVAAAALPIRGDDALMQRAAERGWTGTGTADDPVRITGIQIDARDRSGLRLTETDLHVVIERALIELEGTGDGIHLERVAHVTISETRISGGSTALRVVGSEDVHIHNSTFESAQIGVLLQGVQDVTVRDSRVAFNGVGVYADAGRDAHGPSSRVQVMGNAVLGNLQAAPGTEPDAPNESVQGGGIILAGSGHRVVDNVLTGNGHGGIWIMAADTLVSGNRIDDGLGHGIIVRDATGVRVHHNTMTLHGLAALSARHTMALHVEGNSFAGTSPVALRVRDDMSSTLVHNDIADATNGIVAIRSTDLVVRQNVVELAAQGIDVVEARGATIADNLIEGAVIGGVNLFRSDDVSLSGNRVWRGGGHGIYVGDASTDVRLRANHVLSSPRGITIDGGAKDVHLKNDHIFGPGGVGIGILDATRVHIEGPELLRWDRGIDVLRGEGHRIEGGFLSRSFFAISIGPDAAPVTVSGAKVTLNTVGVHITHSSGHTVHHLDLVMNTEGVLLVDADSTEIAHNWIRDNRIGLHLVNATDNLVYDNLIVNDRLPGDQDFLTQNSPGNTWNVSERAGPNVVGGPRIGGNLWRDYQGPDADGDGLGDVPYWPLPVPSPDEDLVVLDLGIALEGPFDMHPLVVDGDPEAAGAPGAQPEPSQAPDEEGPLTDPRLPVASPALRDEALTGPAAGP